MSEAGALHLVSQSLQSSRALEMCLQYSQPGDTVLFLQGGVASMPWLDQGEFKGKALTVRWLEADVLARGLAPLARQSSWHLVDDDGFVELVEQHSPIHTWT